MGRTSRVSPHDSTPASRDREPVALPLEEEGDDDHAHEHAVDDDRAARLEQDRLLDDADRDGGHHRPREAFHAADHGGGQRSQHETRSERLADLDTLDGQAEEDAHAGHAGGQHPHDGVDALHRDAEQGGPARGLGRGPHRDADAGPAEEQDQPEGDGGHDDDDEEVPAPEHDREPPKVKSKGTGGCGAVSKLNRRGSPSWRAARSWEMPIVATVSTRRGALEKRRISPTSTMKPVTSAARRPIATHTKNGSFGPT
jgi:hypothetical protein